MNEKYTVLKAEDTAKDDKKKTRKGQEEDKKREEDKIKRRGQRQSFHPVG